MNKMTSYLRHLLFFICGFLLVALLAACGQQDNNTVKYNSCATCEANLLSYTAQLEMYEIQTRILAETLEQLNKNYSTIEQKLQTIQVANDVEKADMVAKEIVVFFKVSHATIDTLSLKIGASAIQSESVSRIIGTIRQHLWQQENLFVLVYSNIVKDAVKIEQLKNALKGLDNVIPDAIKNPVHYIIESPNNLLKFGIVKSAGNILGKGGNYQLAEKPKLERFTTAPMAAVSELLIPGKGKHQLITRHPSNTYRLVERQMDAVLYITKPAEFWGQDKLLVVAQME
jgi:hypothetical protein